MRRTRSGYKNGERLPYDLLISFPPYILDGEIVGFSTYTSDNSDKCEIVIKARYIDDARVINGDKALHNPVLDGQ